ncbi:MAG: alpha/beta fold hydrolase [Deltaproteobacteria bacterium]|nr:alpha/beta fold hydrolase [Deltaproteobacteria bacterium]
MSTPVLVFFWSLVSVLALVSFVRLYLWLVARYLHENERFDEIHFATTPDNWRLALLRFRPRVTPLGGAPLILCHGICSNHRTFDLTDRISLARFLADRGHDVWVANLRTVGRSHRLSRHGLAESRATFDDFATLDAPALVQAVLRATGTSAAIWVGHSLGGHVGLAHAAHNPASGLRGVATLATTGDFSLQVALRLANVPRFIAVLPTRLVAHLVAPIARLLSFPPLSHLFNFATLAPSTLRRAVFHTSENLPGPLVNQLRRWSNEGKWDSVARDFDYRAALASVTLPAFIGVAAADRLFPASAYERLFDEIGSTHKTLAVFGRAEGLSHDYGHVDVVLSDSAAVDVYPRLADWIETEQGLHTVRGARAAQRGSAKSSRDAPRSA